MKRKQGNKELEFGALDTLRMIAGSTVVDPTGVLQGGKTLAHSVAPVAVTGATGGDIATGLTTVEAAVAVLEEDSTLAGDTVTCAVSATPGHITVKVWKRTASGDCTPALATVAKNISWIARGVK